MRFLLIPVADALPAVQAHLARWPGDNLPPSPEELRELVELVCGLVPVADALLVYAQVLGGVPSRN